MVLADSHFYTANADTKAGFFATPQRQRNTGNVHPQTGYRLISLQLKNGKRVSEYLHRAIWQSHHKRKIPKGMQIMHKNHQRQDCRISNLQLGTPSENTLASVPNRGPERNRTQYRNKCSVQSPSGKIHRFKSIAACCRKLNLSQSTVGKGLRGQPYVVNAWTHDKIKKYKILSDK